MKLTYRIALHLFLALIPLLALWAWLFYVAMVEEINDETDDALEAYAELIMVRHLAGVPLPTTGDGSNNSYELHEVDEAYACTQPSVHFYDCEVYIPEKREYEPSRVLTSLFRSSENRWFELKVSTPTFERADLQETILCFLDI